MERTLVLVSTTEAAARLGVSRGYLSRLARSGQQCGTSLADRPPNARFCLACYRTRKKAAAAAHYERRKADRAASARG